MISLGITRDALTDRAYEMLRTRIVEGHLAPDERLVLSRLSEELGVSHTPIREALNRLAIERLVSVEPYRGFRVMPLIGLDGMRHLFEARLVIEQGALSRAIDHIDAATLERLRQISDKLDGLASAPHLDISAFNDFDADFHRSMVVASNNAFLLNAFDDLRVHVQIARHYQGRSVEEARQAQAEHRSMLKALQEGRGEAVLQECAIHITNVLTRLNQDQDRVASGGEW